MGTLERGTMSRLSRTAVVLLLVFLGQTVPFLGGQTERAWALSLENEGGNGYIQASSEQNEKTDLEWFKKELRISPKYRERDGGVLGLSWAHFLTMVFLTSSFAIGILALIIRHRRTKELISMLLQERGKREDED
jgi:hypothetical protein